MVQLSNVIEKSKSHTNFLQQKEKSKGGVATVISNYLKPHTVKWAEKWWRINHHQSGYWHPGSEQEIDCEEDFSTAAISTAS